MLGRAGYVGGVAVAAVFLGAVAFQDGPRFAPDSAWREIAWPFGRDAWPPGRAFRCASATCGEGAEVYVRPKIGFCNCTTGVADDDEVDRVTDLDLISERFGPAEAGQEVRIGEMPGRARHYTLRMRDGTVRLAVGFAVSRRCDVVVAVAQGGSAAPPELKHAALDLLSSKAVTAWLDSAL
jgi:hypothetical protein